MDVREWIHAAWELVWGILKRFWLWIVPLVVLQPIDLLEKFGVDLVIPDVVVYGLVGLGVFASAADVLRTKRQRIVALERDADARRVVGTVHMNPALYPADEYRLDPNGPVVGILFVALVQLENHSDSTIVYRVQRFEALVEGVVHRLEHPGNSFPIAKGEYMLVSGLDEFGPYPISSAIDTVVVIEVRLALPNSESTVVEQRRFEFRSQVYREPGRMGARTEIYNPSSGPERYVSANINNDGADWRVKSPFPSLEPTSGPRTGFEPAPDDPGAMIATYAHVDEMDVETGQSVEAGQKLGTIGPIGRPTGAQFRLEHRRPEESDPRDQYQDGK